jgi:hypothetical protein
MSREEAKTAINQLLDQSTEEVLQEVLEFLKSTKDKSTDSIALNRNLRKILEEDHGLLQRLAK